MSDKKTIRRLLEKWTYLLGLRWWTVNAYFYSKPKNVKRFFGKRAAETVIAQTYSDWRYTTANIHLNMMAIRQMDDEEAERVIVHELCHALVCEMREGEQHHEERVVTGLQKAFMWTRTMKDEDNGAPA